MKFKIKIFLRFIVYSFFIIMVSFIIFLYIVKEIFVKSHKFKRIRPGQRYEYVVNNLGKPEKIFEYVEIGDESYKYTGFNRFKFSKPGKVLVYSDKMEVLYILIINGKVAELFIQGS